MRDLTDERLKELRALCDPAKANFGPCCHLSVLRIVGPHPAPCTGKRQPVRSFPVDDIAALLDEVTRLRAEAAANGWRRAPWGWVRDYGAGRVGLVLPVDGWTVALFDSGRHVLTTTLPMPATADDVLRWCDVRAEREGWLADAPAAAACSSFLTKKEEQPDAIGVLATPEIAPALPAAVAELLEAARDLVANDGHRPFNGPRQTYDAANCCAARERLTAALKKLEEVPDGR